MPSVKKVFTRKGETGHDAAKASGKRKSSEFKDSEKAAAPGSDNKGQKKRKLDQIQHVPTLVSSTFNPLEEVDFPRGGAALTPLERKQAENEGIRDALFEVDLTTSTAS